MLAARFNFFHPHSFCKICLLYVSFYICMCPGQRKKFMFEIRLEGLRGRVILIYSSNIFRRWCWCMVQCFFYFIIPPIYSLDGGDVGAWSSARQFSADGHLLRGLPGEIRRKWENRGRENIVKEILIIISV